MSQLTSEQVRKWVKENYPDAETLLSVIYGIADDIEHGASQLAGLDRHRLEEIKKHVMEAVIVLNEGQVKLLDEEVPESLPEELKEWFKNP